MTTTRAEAQVVAARLRSSGIPATVFGGEGGYAVYPVVEFAQGSRVMVRRGDFDVAAQIVADVAST